MDSLPPDSDPNEPKHSSGGVVLGASARLIAGRLHRGRDATAEEGGYIGGELPYGLTLDAWGRWERDPDEEHILRRIAARRAAGATLAAICRWLNDERIPSPNGGQWAPGIVHRLLKNPIYYRDPDAVPDHLIGPRHVRATYNYDRTGILRGHPTAEEIERESHFVTHKSRRT
jgi:hypothetical protein